MYTVRMLYRRIVVGSYMLLYISIGLPAEFFELTPLLLFFRLRPSRDIPVASPIIARIFFVGLYFAFASYILVL